MSTNNSPKVINNSTVHTSINNSPRASPRASPKGNKTIIYSLEEWLTNTHSTLIFPMKVLTVFGMIIVGAFIETAPRKSLNFLDSYIGVSFLYAIPFFFLHMVDWPTGLLAATISVLIYARLHKQESSDEGFTGSSETTIVSDPNRWFVEKVLGEIPLGTVNKNVKSLVYKNDDQRTNSSNSMSNPRSSSGTK